MALVFVDPDIRVGAHIDLAPTIIETAQNTRDCSLNLCQVYLGKYYPQKYTIAELEQTKEICQNSLIQIYAHAPLSILANNNTPHLFRSIPLMLDITSFTQGSVVIHMGSDSDQIRGNGNIMANINRLMKTPTDYQKVIKTQRSLLLENSAGQGNQLGTTLDNLVAIYQGIEDKERVGICLDTQHLFAAGEYDFRRLEEIDRYFRDVELQIGNAVRLIHLNDSIPEFGGKVDRHIGLTKGKLFREENLSYLLRKAKERHLPLILETKGDIPEDLKLLNKLREI